MGESRDDVDGEADQKRSDGGVDRAEEGEDYGQKPDWYHNGKPCQCPQAYAPCVMHPYHLLPHKIQRRTREPKCNKLHLNRNRPIILQHITFWVSKHYKCSKFKIIVGPLPISLSF